MKNFLKELFKCWLLTCPITILFIFIKPIGYHWYDYIIFYSIIGVVSYYYKEIYKFLGF
jgi:hypothetical protein